MVTLLLLRPSRYYLKLPGVLPVLPNLSSVLFPLSFVVLIVTVVLPCRSSSPTTLQWFLSPSAASFYFTAPTWIFGVTTLDALVLLTACRQFWPPLCPSALRFSFNFVHEKVALGEVRVLHVPTSAQFSNILTKELPTASFTNIRFSLNIAMSDVDEGCSWKLLDEDISKLGDIRIPVC
jgi:hypothetical protein